MCQPPVIWWIVSAIRYMLSRCRFQCQNDYIATNVVSIRMGFICNVNNAERIEWMLSPPLPLLLSESDPELISSLFFSYRPHRLIYLGESFRGNSIMGYLIICSGSRSMSQPNAATVSRLTKRKIAKEKNENPKR